MNKTALAIKMLEMLHNSGKKSRKEIAEALEITERKVIDLKQELEVAGYIIDSTTGKYGGYRLSGKNILPALKLTNDEKNALNFLNTYLMNKTDFIYKKQIESVIEKMKIVSNTDYQSFNIIYGKQMLNTSLQNEIEKIEQAIQKQHKIKMHYIPLYSKTTVEYEIEPYWVLFYDHAYYLVGYEVNRQDFRMFKIVAQRMKKIIYTDEYFYKIPYDLSKIIGKLQLVKDELFEVVLHCYDASARLLYEKEIGLNDEKKWINENVLEIKTMVEGVNQIKKLVLSLGKDIKVISPTYLKDEIIKELQFIINHYHN